MSSARTRRLRSHREMPQSVVLIAESDVSLADLARASAGQWRKLDLLEDRLVIEDGPAHVVIVEDPSMEEEYEAEELQSLKTHVVDPRFFLVEFNQRSLLNAVLSRLSENSRLFAEGRDSRPMPLKEFLFVDKPPSALKSS